jgi:sec-independent protein translocase protein TatA
MLGAMSLWHWLIVILVVSILFGRNMISSTMEDLAKGLRKLKEINKEEGH